MAGQRSTGSVTLTLGLLNIPVKIYLAASAEAVSFKRLTKTGHLTSQKIFDVVTNEEVQQKDLDKGYEFAKGKILQFTPEEVNALTSKNCDTATIEAFVPYSSIDVVSIEKSLHIGPDKGADKGYLLLSAAMKAKGVAAVAKWYSRSKENLVVIAPRGDGLIMHQMFYPSEVRNFDNPCAKLPVTDQELALAGVMIDQVVAEYGKEEIVEDKPALYRDNFIDRVNAAVLTKQGGGTIKTDEAPKTVPGGDLMAILQRSVDALKTKAS